MAARRASFTGCNPLLATIRYQRAVVAAVNAPRLFSRARRRRCRSKGGSGQIKCHSSVRGQCIHALAEFVTVPADSASGRRGTALQLQLQIDIERV